MPYSLFLLFNHEITPAQESDARRSLGIQRIVDLPPNLKTLWRHIPPDLDEINGYLEPVKSWLTSEAVKNDYILIQGDFGACYTMATFAFSMGLIPIYSTTEREATEEYKQDGTVKLVHQFKHQAFRKYGV
jgi:hypothetical protein